MPAQFTIPEIIEFGEVSTYLAPNYVSTQSLFGGSVIKPVPPIQIAMVTDGLTWGYDGGGQSNQSLRSTGNYAYWLYGRFGLQAQNIVNGPGGGSVIPVGPTTDLPNPLDFIVGASSFIATGESTVNIPAFIGYNVSFDRNGQPQYTTNPGDGSTCFLWNRVTGDFTLINGDAQENERFRITPIG